MREIVGESFSRLLSAVRSKVVGNDISTSLRSSDSFQDRSTHYDIEMFRHCDCANNGEMDLGIALFRGNRRPIRLSTVATNKDRTIFFGLGAFKRRTFLSGLVRLLSWGERVFFGIFFVLRVGRADYFCGTVVLSRAWGGC